MTTAPPIAERHRLYEDAVALVTGTLLVALGLALYAKATLVVGGTAGLSLLLQYASGYGFGTIFFLVNLPFYLLSIRRMGWPYTIRTFIAVAMVSVLSRLTPQWISIEAIEPLYAAVCGGVLVGIGLLALFRHRAGLGGFNILAVYLQDTYGWRAGYVQLALDVMILIGAAFILPLEKLGLSLVGAAAINLTLAINHRPGRYMGVS
ncbi:MAG: YitT family protein [Rhizobiaceae bacterium]|nr:YitT family protein [Rhizobiaceae bacterium]